MSRNTDKITKALSEKGYMPREMIWEPVGHACEMCGPEGGWYIDVVTISADEYGEHDYVDTILAYSTAEALEEIERLPMGRAGRGGRANMSEEERKISDDKCDSCACSLLDERDKLRDLVAAKDEEIERLKEACGRCGAHKMLEAELDEIMSEPDEPGKGE